MFLFFWAICVVVTVVAIAQAATGTPDGWIAAIFWLSVSVASFIWYCGGWQAFKCRFGGHEWTMERGYDGQPHHTAVCKYCGAKPEEYR